MTVRQSAMIHKARAGGFVWVLTARLLHEVDMDLCVRVKVAKVYADNH